MRKAKTISQIVAELPQGIYWRSHTPHGSPSHLTLQGKSALAILEAHNVPMPQIIELLGLRMSTDAFASFRKLSAITDPDLNLKHQERTALAREGKYIPGLVTRHT